MSSFNSVTLLGNLTKDPEKRYTDGGKCVVSLSLSVNERFKKGDDWVEEVSYFDVVVWGEQGEACAKYLAKGRPALVDGKLKQRRWEAPDGTKRSKVEIVANRVVFLGGHKDEGHAEKSAGNNPTDPTDDPDDIPF